MNKIYKIKQKQKHARCSICPWHRGENYGKRDRRSWKRYRKTRWK